MTETVNNCPKSLIGTNYQVSSDDSTNFQPSFVTPLQNATYTEPWWYLYSYQTVPLIRNYKCHCKGEFFMPATKDGKQVCPFCGEAMKGLNP